MRCHRCRRYRIRDLRYMDQIRFRNTEPDQRAGATNTLCRKAEFASWAMKVVQAECSAQNADQKICCFMSASAKRICLQDAAPGQLASLQDARSRYHRKAPTTASKMIC